jgi:hypothetical protein
LLAHRLDDIYAFRTTESQIEFAVDTLIIGANRRRGRDRSTRSSITDQQEPVPSCPRNCEGRPAKHNLYGPEPRHPLSQQLGYSHRSGSTVISPKAQIECRWHDLRHTFVSRVAAGGATDGTIQAIAGWMSAKMIERYSHVRKEAKEQRSQRCTHPDSCSDLPESTKLGTHYSQ